MYDQACRKWQPTPIFLPGKTPWTEEPGGLSPRGCKESGTTEQLNTHRHRHTHNIYRKIEMEKRNATSTLNFKFTYS